MKVNLMIARFPGDNRDHPESTDLYVNLLEQAYGDRRVGEVIKWQKSDTPITMTRNLSVVDALSKGADFLLMIDNDIGEHPAQKPHIVRWLDFMLNHSGPAIMAAPYCGGDGTHVPYAFEWETFTNPDTGNGGNHKIRLLNRNEVSQRSGYQEVAAMPTGLLMVDMRLFTGFKNPWGETVKLPTPWFDYEWEDATNSKKSSTEDVYFTRNASLLGCPCYCDWDGWVTHHKRQTLYKPVMITAKYVSDIYRKALVSPDDLQCFKPIRGGGCGPSTMPSNSDSTTSEATRPSPPNRSAFAKGRRSKASGR